MSLLGRYDFKVKRAQRFFNYQGRKLPEWPILKIFAQYILMVGVKK